MFSGPNYYNYSDAELREAFESIDKHSYPERYAALSDLMMHKGLVTQTESGLKLNDAAFAEQENEDDDSEPVVSYTSAPPEPAYDEAGNYIPNEIPLKNRVLNSIFALAIMAHGSYGLYTNELLVPLSKRSAITLAGPAAVIMFVAILAAALMMLVEVIDHYDKRDNEHRYYRVARVARNVAYASFSVSIIWGFFSGARIA